MNKKMLLPLVFAVVASLLLGAVTVFAEPDNQWGWESDCWNYGTCYVTPTYCTNSYCGNGYGYGYGTGYGYGNGYGCQARYSRMYQAEFVTDVTYPDGSYVSPGQGFVKTWRLRNIGTASWGTGTSLVFTSGDRMNGPYSVQIPYCVAPGQTVDVSVNLIASGTAGMSKGEWMLQAPNGERFGVGCNGNTAIWVNISNWQPNPGTACYCYGQPNCGCAPCYGNNCSPIGSRAGKNPNCNNKIRDVKDVTVPDGSAVLPGTIFRKTWRMKNGGTCVWDENYLMIFAGGDNMGGADYTRLNLVSNVIYGSEYTGKRYLRKVYPGDYVEISIDLKAPSTPGTYQSYYKLRDGSGYEFGFGSWAADPFWVKIDVSGSLAVSPSRTEKLPELAPAGVSQTANTVTNTDAAVISTKNFDATQVVPTVENKTQPAVAETGTNTCGSQKVELVKESDTEYTVTWSVTNDGTKDWSAADYKLVSAGLSDKLTIDADSYALPDTKVGETAEVSFKATLKEGAAQSEEPLWLEFYVTDGNENFCEFYFEIPK